MERYRGKWLTIGDGTDGVIHVLPETDKKAHSVQNDGDTRELAEHNCPCKPKVSLGGTCYLIVHNSFQDKEFLDTILPITNEDNIK